MKILHINGTIEGGAANYVFKLHEDLIKKKIKSYLYLPKKVSKKNIIYPNNKFNNLYFFLKNLIVRKYFKYLLKNEETNSIAFFFSNYLKKKIEEIDPDLINLHWIGNEVISIKQIKEIKKPIVWTIHDMWLFGGSRHYILPDHASKDYKKNYTPIKKNIFDLNYYSWKNKLKNLDFDIKLVCSSQWLVSCAKKSFITKRKSIIKIPPGLDFNKWKKYPKSTARKALKIKNNEKVILFISAKVFEERKGFLYLYKSLEKIKKQKFTILVIGKQGYHNFENRTHHNFIFIDYLKSHIKKLLYYSAADLLAATSIVEAFGQVICEAASCNTPSIVIKKTGCASIIEHKKNGYIVENKTEINRGINWIFSLSKKQKKIIDQNSRDIAVKNYKQSNITKKYIDLYKDIIKEEVF
jgi:glycosyltransferase involved in cell wall biosynthesis|tara:strand:- start:16912 stop:18141 length:1230 start_codon:yes stop_codon:yes gene_type:complete